MKTRILLVILVVCLTSTILMEGIMPGNQLYKISTNLHSKAMGTLPTYTPIPRFVEVAGTGKIAPEMPVATSTPAQSPIKVDKSYKDDIALVLNLAKGGIGDSQFFLKRDKTKIIYATMKSLISRSPEAIRKDMKLCLNNLLIGIEIMSREDLIRGIKDLEKISRRLE